MARKEQTLEIANFICRFGDEQVMLDRLREIVLPAFQDPNQIRAHGEHTSYRLLDVGVFVFNEAEHAVGIAGRLVKDTLLKSEQVLDPEKGLVHREACIRTSPSSLFLLLLNTHRLLFVKETSDAPGLGTFKTTVAHFLREKHKTWIVKLYQDAQEAHRTNPSLPRLTKADVRRKHPAPDLEVVALASQQTLSAFIQKYDTLKAVEVQLLNPNHDLDNDAFFAAVRKKKDAVGSARTILRHSNPTGLEKSQTIAQLAGLADQGNHLIKLDGKDTAGDRLKGNNEEFQLKIPMGNLGLDVKEACHKMYESFESLTQAGTIKAAEVTQKVKEILSGFLDTLQ